MVDACYRLCLDDLGENPLAGVDRATAPSFSPAFALFLRAGGRKDIGPKARRAGCRCADAARSAMDSTLSAFGEAKPLEEMAQKGNSFRQRCAMNAS